MEEAMRMSHRILFRDEAAGIAEILGVDPNTIHSITIEFIKDKSVEEILEDAANEDDQDAA